MKVWVIGLVLLLVACASMGPSSSFRTARASSVVVVASKMLDGGLEVSNGAGVVVDSHCVLTADHVVAGLPSVSAGFPDGTNLPMDVFHENADMDLALLCSTSTLPAPAIAFGATPAIDDPVFTVGNPLEHANVLTEGRYEDADLVTTACAPGNSGGGVYNANGELIGIADNIALTIFENAPLAFPHLCGIIGMDAIIPFLGQS